MKNHFFIADVDGVSGVGASGGADDHVVFLCEYVDEFSFSFISPLASDDNADLTSFLFVHCSEDTYYKIRLSEYGTVLEKTMVMNFAKFLASSKESSEKSFY